MDAPSALFPVTTGRPQPEQVPVELCDNTAELRDADRQDACAAYTPRRPEKSVLYRVVQQHVMTLFSEAEARSEHGCGYPAHVRREFSRFLACGQLARGFARIKCSDCGFERLLPLSCKGRSLCPSCQARRMADIAAHLVDHVLPVAPYRQWTLSLPHDIRLLVIRNPDLLSRVLQLFLRAVFAYQRRRARQDGIKDPMPGAVTMLQFWGSVLQLTPHAHSWLPDGALASNSGAALSIVAISGQSSANGSSRVRYVRSWCSSDGNLPSLMYLLAVLRSIPDFRAAFPTSPCFISCISFLTWASVTTGFSL